MKFHGKFFKQFGQIDTPEILQSLLNSIGIELTNEEAESIFKDMDLQRKKDEDLLKSEIKITPLSEEELAQIAGGKGEGRKEGSDVGRRCTTYAHKYKGTKYYGQPGTVKATYYGHGGQCGWTFWAEIQFDNGDYLKLEYCYLEFI